MSKKAPKTKERSIKIKYAANKMTTEELASLIVAFVAVVFFAVPYIYMAYDISQLHFLVPILVLFVFIGCPGIVYFDARRKRMVAVKEQKMMIAYGKKVIGSIVSLNTIELGENKNDKNFVYTIEYEEPEKGEKFTLVTPPILKDRYFIKESDLPLKVVVYCYKRKAFADRIINPPISKMVSRKITSFFLEHKMIFTVLSVISALIIIGVICGIINNYILSELFLSLAFFGGMTGLYIYAISEKYDKK